MNLMFSSKRRPASRNGLRRGLAVVLCACMLLPFLGDMGQALISEDPHLCPHHPAHTAECGGLEDPALCGFPCGECAQAEDEPGEPAALADVSYKYVNQWVFLDGAGQPMTEPSMEVTVLDGLDQDAKARMIRSQLPAEIRCWGFSSAELSAAGFEQDSTVTAPTTDADGNTHNGIWGKVKLEWTVTLPDPVPAEGFTVYAAPVYPGKGYQIVVNSNVPGGANSLADPQLLAVTVVPREVPLSDHIVPAVEPPDTRVDLFDYWVDTDGAAGKDLLSKNDWHCNQSGTQNIPRTGPSDWDRGINTGRLLLFGDGNIHAGFWNKGAGAGSDYGKAAAGMPGIVENRLVDGYPVVDTAEMERSVDGYPGISDYNLCGDHDGAAGTGWTSTAPKNLSDTVIANWRSSGNDASLDYLFDPEQNTPFRRAYPDVSGLFQIDSNGYYYYNMRKNFAEFDGNDRFILYDAPAVDRTDGLYDSSTGDWSKTRSIGNFLPFNTAGEVFTGVEDGRLVNNDTIQSNNTGALTANHHLGMTLSIDFRQPDDGMINMGINGRAPMSFQFSGDDDVWIFIDDVLVLDLGGIHSEIYGTIDFATGEISVGQSWRTNGFPYKPDGTVDMDALKQNSVSSSTLRQQFAAAGLDPDAHPTDWRGETFASNTTHTLKMFYLERGNYDSSLAVRFNLQPRLYQQLKKVDQNGDPIRGVEFALYEAAPVSDAGSGAIRCVDTGTHRVTYVRQTGTAPIAVLNTDENGVSQFLDTAKPIAGGGYEPFNFADRTGEYYVLKETNAPAGYRMLPIDVVLRFHRETTTLVVANRWSTGAYASAVSHIVGSSAITYGRFADESGTIDPTPDRPVSAYKQQNGLVVAIPMLRQGTAGNRWIALYGSNVDGFRTSQSGMASAVDESVVTAWRDAVLSAALYQAGDASPNAPHWHLDWNADSRRLEGTLNDLPGMASRYRLNNPNGDMRMIYGIIEPDALRALGITGRDADERYTKLGQYVRDHGVPETLAVIKSVETQNTGSGMGFSFLNVDQFNRDFRSLIYIPNEQRQLRVQKVDQDARGLNGAVFGLFRDKDCTDQAASGVTARVDGQDGTLIFTPNAPRTDGYAAMVWANSADTQYYLKELSAPAGYTVNPTVVPVIVGTYSIYADAGAPEDGVSVMAGVGKLAQTMTKYASDGAVNITLRDITAVMQQQPSGGFSLTGWTDSLLDGTRVPRQMNLHYGLNAVVDYGLHDEDGGAQVQPFFVTDTGFIRARVVQNTAALTGSMYPNADNSANFDTLVTDTGEPIDVTSLFSLLNVVVVTDQATPAPETGTLSLRKQLAGDGLTDGDYTRNFAFTVTLTDADGEALTEQYFYRGRDKSGYLRSGDTLLLHHDDWVDIQGLPDGTRFTVTEAPTEGWHVTPASGTVSGTVRTGQTAPAAFRNSKSPDAPEPTPNPPYIPTPTPTPTPTPVPSPTPTPHPDLPDPNDPDSPDEVTIIEEGVPKTYRKVWDPVKEEWEYLPDEEVPLDYIPATGEGPTLTVLVLVCTASLTGILLLVRPHKGRRGR